jgi:SAM-dependent methyltransferase
MRQPHQHRQIAESFGEDAEHYDRTRPSYPDALVERIIAASPGRDVLDVGCGTGIAARLFQAAGCRVLGVEPDPRMADLARRGGLEVEVATFEDWDPAGRDFDVVTAAQAWHWVEPAAGAARVARVLRPGGRFAAFWNSFQPPDGLVAAFAEVYRRVSTGLPFTPWDKPVLDGYLAMCERAADGLRQAGAFGDPEVWRFEWDRPYTRDEWLDLVPTWAGHGRIPPAALKDLLAGIGSAVDAAGGHFTMRFTTVAITALAGPA